MRAVPKVSFTPGHVTPLEHSCHYSLACDNKVQLELFCAKSSLRNSLHIIQCRQWGAVATVPCQIFIGTVRILELWNGTLHFRGHLKRVNMHLKGKQGTKTKTDVPEKHLLIKAINCIVNHNRFELYDIYLDSIRGHESIHTNSVLKHRECYVLDLHTKRPQIPECNPSQPGFSCSPTGMTSTHGVIYYVVELWSWSAVCSCLAAISNCSK